MIHIQTCYTDSNNEMTSFLKTNVINVWFKSVHGRRILIFDTDMSMNQFNIFRRILLSEIAVIAIDLVHMIENKSIMVDEVLSNRLGAIPVMISNQNSIIRKDLCECQYFCNKCSFIIDFECKEFTRKTLLMSDDVSPFLMKDIPIVTVQPGQKISFKLLCSKSISQEHYRWSPGVVCSITHITNEPKFPNCLRVTLHNTGPIDFSNILEQVFSLMRTRLRVDIRIH